MNQENCKLFPKLQHPSTIIISGPSSSGKSTFTVQLLHNLQIFNQEIKKVIWCNSERGAIPHRDTLPADLDIEFINKLPQNFENVKNVLTIVILDDMMVDASASLQVSELFSKGSHHRNITVVLITQNIFHKSKHSRDISLNAKYLVIFKNPRDKAQFNHLARQIYPENVAMLQKMYKSITATAHSYLFIDLTQGINDILRFRTNIFNKEYCECYCPNDLLNSENGAITETIKGQQAYVIRNDEGKT